MCAHTFTPLRVFEVYFVLISGFLTAPVLSLEDSWAEKTRLQRVLVSPGRVKFEG